MSKGLPLPIQNVLGTHSLTCSWKAHLQSNFTISTIKKISRVDRNNKTKDEQFVHNYAIEFAGKHLLLHTFLLDKYHELCTIVEERTHKRTHRGGN